MENNVDLQILTNTKIILRLAISAIIGGVIGFEREKNHQAAGLRTNMLVAIGSCLIMLLSIKMHELYGADPARIAAQVISGIGFLGAGTIITNTGNNSVHGLTTAATLWVNSGIGLAIGAGLYFGGIVTGVIVLIVLAILAKFNVEK